MITLAITGALCFLTGLMFGVVATRKPAPRQMQIEKALDGYKGWFEDNPSHVVYGPSHGAVYDKLTKFDATKSE